MQSGVVDDRVEFLFGELWGGYAALLKKCFFRPAMFFCMLPFNAASHLCCYFGVFAFFRVLGGLAHHNFDEAEQNQWNAMLEMCFHDVVAPRFLLAAGPHSVATLSVTCLFARDVLDGPRENQVVHVFD